ncbi:hypothetical protein ACVWZK_000634 [Bradyrhizobium sp. GM0.4]
MKPTTIAEIENRKNERRAEQTELLGLELQLGHDRNARETDDDLVGEVHQHEKKQEKCNGPGALWRLLLRLLLRFLRRFLGHPRHLARRGLRCLSAHRSPRRPFLALF